MLTKKDVGLEEAQAAARLKHPHIVSVYDVATPQDELPFIIFDHVAGETLEERLKEAQHQRLPLDEESLRIVRQISTALDYAHKQGVIHQDVKPSNIILDRNGNAHLTDFGLAKIKQPDCKSAHTEYQRQLSGTISHMAPELLRGSGRSGDERSDLYSLGVVVYEMLNGPPPYPGLPQGIEAVLRQALDQNPAKRYPSCQDFADALEQAVQAYQAASNKYDEAQKLIELGRWRRAKPILEALEQQTPGFKDTAHHLEQARLQGRLSKFYKQAQDAVSRKDYQSALHALQALSQLSPDYDVTDLPQQVEDGLAREKQRQLNNQYQRTEELFQEKRYQDCLDILVAIREQDPDYVYPSENLARIAREQVELQQQQRDRYDQGAEYMRQEQWEQALAIFQDLQSQAPDYEDVDTRLAMARHMARLSSLLQQAQELLDDGQPAACVEKLNKLQGIDPEYKQEQVAQLKLEAMSKQQNILSQTCPRCGHENQGPHHRKTCSQCDAELLLGINEVLKGRYHVLQELGRGAVGAVFQAQDKETGQVVAIKEQRDKTQFEYEQSILQSLDHPQLPHIYDHFEHEDKLYLVIEFVDGRSLGDIIDENAKAGRFQRWHLVDGWAMELYTVLEYLHNKRIIHGDIKPANIRLNTQGEIVLVDLGVAKNLSSMPSEETPEYEKSAQEGKSVPEDRVTVGYAAIEQFLPGYEPPDERADIYALGATLLSFRQI